jgi:hypothetical protein
LVRLPKGHIRHMDILRIEYYGSLGEERSEYAFSHFHEKREKIKEKEKRQHGWVMAGYLFTIIVNGALSELPRFDPYTVAFFAAFFMNMAALSSWEIPLFPCS